MEDYFIFSNPKVLAHIKEVMFWSVFMILLYDMVRYIFKGDK